MLDVSNHGAAMLAPRASCPAVGDRLDISLVDPELALGSEVARYLLHQAKVHRLDPAAPSLTRVAFCFSSDLWQQDGDPLWQDLVDLVADREVPPDEASAGTH